MTRFWGVLALLFAIILPQPALAQDAIGRWAGTLEINETISLPLVVTIASGQGGELYGTMDSPSQGAMGIPLANIAAAEGSLSFDVPAVAGRYEARWDAAASHWAGHWSQGGMRLPLNLAAAPQAARASHFPADWQVPGDAEIAALIDRRISARPGAGIVVGVIDDGRRRFVARGPAGAAAFDGHTIFEIGSMTKVFTSAALSAMAKKGEVALDDPVARLLPEGSQVPARGDRAITLADLATHSSGLPRLPDNLTSYELVDPYADYDERRLLDFLGRYQLTRTPGLQFEYSNVATGLLGHALARRAGTSYEELVRRTVTGPLGMDDTSITLTAAQRARFAQGHDAEMRTTVPWRFDALAAAGALRSTADDMLTFLAAAMGEGPADLVAAMLDMTQLRRPGPNPRARMALGWMVVEGASGPIYFHDGGTGGFRAAMAFDPERRRGIVVLTNAAVEPSADDLALHLLAGTPLARAQAPSAEQAAE